MSTTWSVRPDVDPSPTAAALVVGDLVAIGAFVVAGEIEHGYHPVADAGRVAGTLAPFVLGWVLVGLAAGLFTSRAVESPLRAVLWTFGGWLVAVVVAQSLRATALFHGDAALTFALVSAGVGGLLLTGWRLAVAILRWIVTR